MMKKIRLDKLLSTSGFGSRKEVKGIIKNSDVLVDGKLVKDPGFILDPHSSKVSLNGEAIDYRDFYYLMLNKPQGLISATQDNYHGTVLDLLDDSLKHRELFPVGRLDIDTEGLLLLTDDGKLAHRLTSPRKNISKTYQVRVRGRLSEKEAQLIKEGLPLEDFLTKPGSLEILESGDISLAHLTIYEGKFHQVKRMFHHLGMEVLFLKRIALGPLSLDKDLAPGSYRELTKSEIDLLKK